MGDVEARLNEAQWLIERHIGVVVAHSSLHKTEPWGFECSQPFTNIAWLVSTDLEPMDVMENLLRIEEKLGRNRKAEYRAKVLGGQPYADRMIDLDILLYGQRVVVTPHLQIPHPLLLKRDFAMVPMCEALRIDLDRGVEMVRDIVANENIDDNEI